MSVLAAKRKYTLLYKTIFLLALSYCIVSGPAGASVIPPQPVIDLSIVSDHINQTVTIYADWSLHGNPDIAPPDHLLITLHKQPEGTAVLNREIGPDPDLPVSGDGIRHFRGDFKKADIPDGSFILAATDPVSGAGRHITMSFRNPGTTPGMEPSSAPSETVFFMVSAVVIIVLLIVLASLIRPKQ